MSDLNALEIYDSITLPKIPEIPQRSRLFFLEPIGVGTPWTESLSSYLCRLAQEHCVTPQKLITREIAPFLALSFQENTTLTSKNYQSRDFFCIKDRTGAANGTGIIASDLVQALEQLTLRENLIDLTLLKWSPVLSQRKLTRSVKAWCPSCYQEWYSKNQIIYDPLLWSFHTIDICPHHHLDLQTRCPHCHQELLPLASKSRPGYCSNCGQWLGQNISCDKSILKEKSWQTWVINNLGSIVAHSPNLSTIDQKKVAQSLQMCIEQTTQGNIAAFARLIGFPKNQVWMWSKGKVIPQLSALLRTCYFLRLPLLTLLTEEKFKINDYRGGNAITQKKTRQKSQITDLKFAEESLKLILSQSQFPPPSLTEVAKQLGFNRRTLTRRFPELCKAISANYLEYRQSQRLQKMQKCALEIEQAVIELDRQGIYPSESNVSKLISQPGYFREKEVRAALKKARQSLLN